MTDLTSADDVAREIAERHVSHPFAINKLAMEITAALQAERALTEWQPIETAPKDGSRMLLAKIVGHPDHPTSFWWCCAGQWSAKWNNWNDGIEPCGLAGPTHWRPIFPLAIRALASAGTAGDAYWEREYDKLKAFIQERPEVYAQYIAWGSEGCPVEEVDQ